MRHTTVLALVLTAAALAGCDMLGDSSEKIAAAKEAEGKAVGGACRHAGRAIEDCYTLNKKADKASVFAGWRDMNDYMRENKIDAVAPQLAGGKAVAVAAEPKAEAKAAESKSEAKPVMAEAAAAEEGAAEKRPAHGTGKAKGHES